MDFWLRLVNRTPLSSSGSRNDLPKDPTRRLHRFEREYGNLLQIWRNSSNLARDADAADIEIRLQELTAILGDESRRPLPHPCIQLAALKQMYVSVGKIASSSLNKWIVKEAVLFFATLVESEEEAFVENVNFSASLTNFLVRITGANGVRLDSVTEARIVELAFNITTKIRLNPVILSAWFKTESGQGPNQTHMPTHTATDMSANPAQDLSKSPRESREKFEGRMQKRDFPLFYILMDYIHHEGKVGDFARTGLLYLIESASASVALEQWIVESDLATLMATSLGALYSQLSRKLVIDHLPHELPPILAFSDYEHPTSNYEIESSCSPEFQSHLDTFLSHLLFWQDVLNHCRSMDIKQTLLEHFQVIFLQQLLYPSLLESSDVDGGSSVAVLTYLRQILESLDHPDMINLILHYLLALPDTAPPCLPTEQSSVSVARKRKSVDLLSMMAEKSDLTASPVLFNLVDLVHACLKSHNQQTIHVTLLLLSCILKRHHRYAVTTLLRTAGLRGDNSRRTVGAHQEDIEYFMRLAGVMGGQDNFDEIYDGVLRDTVNRLESHPCSLRLIAPKLSTDNHDLPAIPDTLPGAPRDVGPHTIRPSDPILGSMLEILQTFFLNSVETNLSVTEAILDLGICGYTAIEGWLIRDPATYAFDNDFEEDLTTLASESLQSSAPPEEYSALYDEMRQLGCLKRCRRRPKWQSGTLPRLLNIVSQLCDQVAAYRLMIPRFDDLLQQRREAFQTADTAVATSGKRKPSPLIQQQPQLVAVSPGKPGRYSPDNLSRSMSLARPSALEGFAYRIFSELGTPSRSNSPGGHKDPSRSPAATSHIGSPPLTPQGTGPMPIPPRDLPSPRIPALSFSPSKGESNSGSIVASQAAAFAAVDQAILARRVAISGEAADQRSAPMDVDFDAPGSLSAGGLTNNPSIRDDLGGNESDSEAQDSGAKKQAPQEQSVTVSHVLTNTILLQSFLFELAGLVQVRAGLFGEVRFI